MKLDKFYPRDVIGIIALVACLILIGLGINHIVSGITIMIITFYFSRRIYDNPEVKKKS